MANTSIGSPNKGHRTVRSSGGSSCSHLMSPRCCRRRSERLSRHWNQTRNPIGWYVNWRRAQCSGCVRSRSECVTLNTLLQAAWVLLLQRYCGQRTVVFGTTVAGRPTEVAGSQEMLGLFINTLPLIQTPDPEQRVGSWLRALQAANLALREHEQVPLYELQRWAGRAGQTLFDSIWVFENYPIDEALRARTRDALKMGTVSYVEPTHYAMTVILEQSPATVQIAFCYWRSCFEERNVQALRGHWLALLESLTVDPERCLGELPWLSEAETARILAWSAGKPVVPAGQCLHELIEARVREQPQAVALMYADTTLTYEELNARANQLARHLRLRGVGPDVLVGLAVERSLDMVIGLLGILKAGGAYVPLDPGYPRERLAFMIEDAGLTWVLTQAHLVESLPLCRTEDRASCSGGGVAPDPANLPLSVWCLDQDWHEVEQHSRTDPINLTTPHNLAYCIYTSGSTGKPKGAGNTHAAIINRLNWNAWLHDAWSEERILHKTPFSFDVSVWELFWPLIAGARLVIAPPGAHQDPRQLGAVIRAQQVTTVHFVPSMLQAFVDSGEQSLPSLRRVMCSGEALPRALQQAFAQCYAVPLHNLYGPTEAAIEVSHWVCREEAGASGVPIGRPLWNTQLLILDAQLNFVPEGICGELYIGGAGLARGYHGRPGLTAERFVPNPWGRTPGERLYRTGDRVRWRPDGAIEYLGRLDSQVKVRGFRIELGEIEAQLQAHPEVQAAAVIARDTARGKQLVGYVVARLPAQDAFLDRVAAHLHTLLPDYMVPARWLQLAALPLTPNGKLDRRALPEPSRVAEQYLAPQAAVERQLAGIWQAVLGVDRVGVRDNFFELGGDSILSLQIIARARRAGLKLTPRQVFEKQTVAELAAVAERIEPRKASSSASAPVSGAMPLTPIQLEFFAQAVPHRHHWNQSVLLRVRERLDEGALERALQGVLVHHDALRLRYREDLSGGWSAVHAEASEEARGLLWVREAGSAADAHGLYEQAQRSLSLEEGPLLRAVYVRLADGSARLLLVIHHLVVDGVSWRVLLEDLQSLYGQQVRGEVLTLPSQTSAFQAWAERLRRYAGSQELAAELPYWRAQLDPNGLRELPRDHDVEALPMGEALRTHVRLDGERTGLLLTQTAQAYRTQINDLLLTALARVLCRWSGVPSVLIALEGHGREDLFEELDLSRTMGWFTSVFPVRLTLPAKAMPDGPNATGAGVAIKAIKEQLRAIPHRGVGYGVLKFLSEDSWRSQLDGLAVPR